MVTDTQVKTGYMETEVGIIPRDWDVEEFGDICGLSKAKINPVTTKINYKCIELEHLESGTGRLLGYANSRELKSQKNIFEKGDTLFGKLRPYLRKFYFPNFDGVCTTEIWVLKSNNNVSKEWLYYLVQSNIVLESANQSIGSKMPRAEWNTVKKTLVPIPTAIAEQEAIAYSLRDIDGLILKLDQLIEKKRNIKQGTMQELLTGKRRLPGFSGEWEEYELPNVCWFQEGPGVRNTQFTSSGVKLLNGTNIFKGKIYLENTDRFISESEAYGPYSHFLADNGDIVIASSGVSIEKFEEKIAFVENSHLPLCMNTSTIRFKTNEKYLIPKFLYYYLMTTMFKEQIGAQATGSAQLNFGPAHLKKIVLEIPNTSEQKAISNIIGDLDKEIELLENQKNKYLDVKQGMMQQLLTGRIRLV